MVDSIFTRIINGEIPSYKIYEDDKTFAFLDIHPKQPGHVLVVPKTETDHIWDLSDTDYQALMAATKLIANRIRQILHPTRVGIQVEGTGVPHAHVHVFPFSTVEEFRATPDMSADPDQAALAEMAQKLAF
jgi:histidine triad (HIT) family protein